MKMNRTRFVVPRRALAGLFVLAAVTACEQPAQTEAVTAESPRLVLYTSLTEERAADLVSAYPQASGVTIHHMLGSPDDLIRKMATKEHHPGPDVLLISGAGAIARAAEEDVLRPLRLPALDTG